MNFVDLMNKIRQMDNKSSQWFFRHFYVLFFQVILVIAFIIFFIVTINLINMAPSTEQVSRLEHLIVYQNVTDLLIAFLLILNSFWMLILLTGILKMRSVLRNIDFNLSRRHSDRRIDDTF